LLDHPESTLLSQVKSLTLLKGDSPYECALLSSRTTPACSLLRFAEITDRNQAEALIGHGLYVKKESLPPPAPDEIYLYQLEGKQVITQHQENIGVVEAFLETNGKTPIMVVRGAKGEYLLPVIPDVVLEVNEETNTVTINLLEGFEPT
jgi:16S rRNA processing protein RimM